MKINIYMMPKNIINTRGVYEFISLLWATYRSMTNNTIILNCCNTKNIDLSLMAPLGLVLTKIKSNKNKIYFRQMNKIIKNKLIKAEFIGQNISSSEDILQNCIKYKTFNGDNNDIFREYIISQLKDLKDIEAVNLLISRIMELFINVKMHARINNKNRYSNKEVFSAGEYYKEDNYIVFSVANNGITLKENIEKNITGKLQRECDYIKWALQKANSTRKTDTDGPGGLGLYLLVELVKECQGILIICSGKGFYKFNAADSTKNEDLDFTCEFPGTVITIKIPIEYIPIDTRKINENMIFNMESLLKEV